MDRGKWIRVSLLLMLALTLAIPAMAQPTPPRDPTLSDSQEPGSVIVFPKFIQGTVDLAGGETAPRTEIELGLVCPKGILCPEGQRVKIRGHWVCPGDQTFENKYICKEVDFDVFVTVNGKLTFNPDGTSPAGSGYTRVPPAPCPRGYLLAWAINTSDVPIKFDGLIGDAVIRETDEDAAAYNAIPIQAYPPHLHNTTLSTGPSGRLVFDGGPGHYQAVTGKAFCDVRFDDRTGPVQTGTFLTLLTLDVKSNRPNSPTYVDLKCYNQAEVLLSTFTEFICWQQVGLTRSLMDGVPPINAALTETGMGSRKGICLAGPAEQFESPFSEDEGPVTLLALVETLEFDGQVMRSYAYNCFNDSKPVPTKFRPTDP